jgi:DNA polymerase III alpha subunit
MTLEDETGFLNLVIWPKKFSEYALLIKTTAFLGATGKVQYGSGASGGRRAVETEAHSGAVSSAKPEFSLTHRFSRYRLAKR